MEMKSQITKIALDSGMAAEVFVAGKMITSLLGSLMCEVAAADKAQKDADEQRYSKEMIARIEADKLREKDRTALVRLAKPTVDKEKEVVRAAGGKVSQVAAYFMPLGMEITQFDTSWGRRIALDPEIVPAHLKPWVIASKEVKEAEEVLTARMENAASLLKKYNDAYNKLMDVALEKAIDMQTQAFQAAVGIELTTMASILTGKSEEKVS